MNDLQLTDRQRAFAEHYVSSGGKVGIASQRAGYADRAMGSKLLRDPKVLKHIQELMVDELTAQAPRMLGVVARIARSAKSEYVQLEAAKDWLDRAGYKPPDKQLVKLSGDLSVSFDVSPVTVDVSPETGGLENSE